MTRLAILCSSATDSLENPLDSFSPRCLYILKFNKTSLSQYSNISIENSEYSSNSILGSFNLNPHASRLCPSSRIGLSKRERTKVSTIVLLDRSTPVSFLITGISNPRIL